MCYGGCFLLVFAENVVRVVDFRLGRLENTAPVHESKFRKRVGFILPPGGPQEARVASGGCFLLVFAENVVMVVDFRLGRLENIAPVHESKLRKRVGFYFGPGCARGGGDFLF